jgi:glycine C-acetyltransferase
VEGVYGLDGDVAPLPDLMRVARAFDARVMIDESHATGVLGASGRGTTEHFGLSEPPDIVMDSLSKSLGSMGGWIGAPAHAIDYLRYFSRPISFAVGLPAVSAAAGLAALRLMLNDRKHVVQLKKNIAIMKSGLLEMGLKNPAKSESAIMSFVIGDELKLRQIDRELAEAGIWMEAVPYPAVPRGEERLRLRVLATHTEEDIGLTLRTLQRVLVKYGIVTPRVSVTRPNFSFASA